MILAAGLGTRMRPLTNERPKPLIDVRGRKLIDRVVSPLLQAGVRRLVVNVHYLADQIEAHVQNYRNTEIVISDEREDVLETGGALAKARPLLGDDPIFVLNTDAFWAPESAAPLHLLAQQFDPSREDERLLLADTGRCLGFDGAGDFFMNEDGAVRRRGEAAVAPWAYSGARIMRPQVYDGIRVERFSALRVWDELIAKGRLKGTALDSFWLHVGDPQALKDAEMWIACHGG